MKKKKSGKGKNGSGNRFNTKGVLTLGVLGVLAGAAVGICTGGIGVAIMGTAYGLSGSVAGGTVGGLTMTTLSTILEAIDPSDDT